MNNNPAPYNEPIGTPLTAENSTPPEPQPYTPSVEEVWEVMIFGARINAKENGVELDEEAFRAMYDRFIESLGGDNA